MKRQSESDDYEELVLDSPSDDLSDVQDDLTALTPDHAPILTVPEAIAYLEAMQLAVAETLVVHPDIAFVLLGSTGWQPLELYSRFAEDL
jgi:hypothetical protein